jgi:hypothetical protein
MKSPFRKPLVRVFAFVAALGSATLAADGSRWEHPQAFHVESAGQTYRLELEGSFSAVTFEARLFRLARTLVAPQAPRAVTMPPAILSPIPYDPASATLDGPPDAVWSVASNGTTTLVTIQVGPDRVESAVPAGDGAKTVACWPEDPARPLWLEINGVPLDVPTAMADVQFDARSPGKSGSESATRALFVEPARFFQEFGRLHGLVLASIAPAASDVDRWAKSNCHRPCLSCATGILRVTGLVGATVLTCSSVGVTAGASTGGCVLSMLFAHAAVVDAGLRCAACDRCTGSQRDSPDDDCACPCTGEPMCDCEAGCSQDP